MRGCRLAAGALAALALNGGVAHAQTAIAAQTGVGTLYPCPSFCGGSGGRFDFDIDGGEGLSSSFSSLSNIDGHGRAEAVLSGPVGLPVLRAEAYSTPGGSSNALADAVGMQGFYVGADGMPAYTLNLVLTGQATGSVRATVLVFRDADPSSAPGFSTGASTMAFEIIPSDPDLLLVDQVNLTLPATGAPASASDTVNITGLDVGDLFYVWASLNASGIRGTYGDAFNTLSLSYADATGLSQTAPVPEPGSLLLAGLGLGALWARGLAGRRGARKL